VHSAAGLLLAAVDAAERVPAGSGLLSQVEFAAQCGQVGARRGATTGSRQRREQANGILGQAQEVGGLRLSSA